MKLANLFTGSGDRRRTPASYAALEQRLSAAQRAAKPLEGTVLCGCAAGRHKDWLAYADAPQPCPWCEIGLLRAREASSVLVVAAPPAGPPMLAAAVDSPGFQPLPAAPLVSADDQLLLMPDAPTAPAECEAADVNAQTQAVAVSELWNAIGEGATTRLPAIVDPRTAPPEDEPSSAEHLERARVKIPPKPPQPPVHLVEQQRVAWGVKPVTDPLAQGDLKDRAPATAVLSLPGWRSARVDLTKTG